MTFRLHIYNNERSAIALAIAISDFARRSEYPSSSKVIYDEK